MKCIFVHYLNLFLIKKNDTGSGTRSVLCSFMPYYCLLKYPRKISDVWLYPVVTPEVVFCITYDSCDYHLL